MQQMSVIAAATAGTGAIFGSISVLAALVGILVVVAKAGRIFGATEEHLKAQDETLDAQNQTLQAQNEALADLQGKLDNLLTPGGGK